jgi:hypothetical protein
MVRLSRGIAILLVCMMVLIGMPRDIQAWAGGDWGFESGELGDWSAVSAVDYVGVTAADEYATP